MTPEMLERARAAASEAGVENVEFVQCHVESLPIPDGWADVVISNGAVNLCPDKSAVFGEMFRVLKPGGPPSDRRHSGSERSAPVREG
jgi:arsenite methyltransferase